MFLLLFIAAALVITATAAIIAGIVIREPRRPHIRPTPKPIQTQPQRQVNTSHGHISKPNSVTGGRTAESNGLSPVHVSGTRNSGGSGRKLKRMVPPQHASAGNGDLNRQCGPMLPSSPAAPRQERPRPKRIRPTRITPSISDDNYDKEDDYEDYQP